MMSKKSILKSILCDAKVIHCHKILIRVAVFIFIGVAIKLVIEDRFEVNYYLSLMPQMIVFMLLIWALIIFLVAIPISIFDYWKKHKSMRSDTIDRG